MRDDKIYNTKFAAPIRSCAHAAQVFLSMSALACLPASLRYTVYSLQQYTHHAYTHNVKIKINIPLKYPFFTT